jgi:hypothetical protein
LEYFTIECRGSGGKRLDVGYGIQLSEEQMKMMSYDTEQKRQSDVYAMCLLSHKDKLTLNPLGLGQWEFYIVPTALLNESLPTQKSVSLSLLKNNDITPCDYTGIRPCIEEIISRL